MTRVKYMHLFNRDKNLEKEIDICLYKRKGYDGLHVYAISSYIDRLNEFIEIYGKNAFDSQELESFLKYNSRLYLRCEDFPIPLREYMEKLNYFVSSLKKDLNISNFVSSFKESQFISDFISVVIDCDFDVKKIIGKYEHHAQRRNYGLIISQRDLNYIYIENDLDISEDLRGKTTYVLYSEEFFSKSKCTDLISLPYVMIVVQFNRSRNFCLHHKLMIDNNHSFTYYRICKRLEEKYPSNDECINKIKK